MRTLEKNAHSVMLRIFVAFVFCVCQYNLTAQINPDDPAYEQWKLNGGGQSNESDFKSNSVPEFFAPVEIKQTNGLLIPRDGSFIQAMNRNDDSYTNLISFPFNFGLYGTTYSSCYINNNGNVSFNNPYYNYTPYGFPVNGFAMIAAFWADIDTRNPSSGLVWYKIESHRFTVIWEQVGYFGSHADKLNTFELIFTDGTDPILGSGINVAFSYGDMQWTTGDASGGSNGFWGVAATVGTNKGDGSGFSQIGRFDHAGSDWDGAGGNNDGISYLDNKIFYFNTSSGNQTDIYVYYNSACIGNADILRKKPNETVFSKIGETGPNGEPAHIYVEIGDELRAEKKFHTEPAVKHTDITPTMFELWIDSDKLQYNSTTKKWYYQTKKYNSNVSSINLTLQHTIYKYDLVLSLDYPLSNFSTLETALTNASAYLLDATDGQVMLKNIYVFDEGVNQNSSDIFVKTGEARPITWSPLSGLAIDHVWSIAPFVRARIVLRQIRSTDNVMSDKAWYTQIAHEFGHYAFGLFDEYLDGYKLEWNANKWNPGGPDHPVNYGLMQDDWLSPELSSNNDYLTSARYLEIFKQSPDVYLSEITYQYWLKSKPCWSTITDNLKSYYSEISFHLPPDGWYPGSEYSGGCDHRIDLLGPSAGGINQQTTVWNRLQDTDRKIYEIGSLAFLSQNRPISAVQVYPIQNELKHYFGESNSKGEIDINKYNMYDNIYIEKRIEGNFLSGIIKPDNSNTKSKIELSKSKSEKTLNLTSTTTGAVVNFELAKLGGDFSLKFDILFDKPISQFISAIFHYDNLIQSVNIIKPSNANRYEGTVIFNPETINADGSGYFEFRFVDDNLTEISFLSEFQIALAAKVGISNIDLDDLNLNIGGAPSDDGAFGVISSTYFLPYSSEEHNLFLVKDMYSINFEDYNSYTNQAGLNLYYSDADAYGLDESTIGIYKWNSNNLVWERINLNAAINVAKNVATASISSSGIYALFATSDCDDGIPPGSINDLNAIPGEGQANIILTWASSGNDLNIGNAASYDIRYNESPITESNWAESINIPFNSSPKTPGSTEFLSAWLPDQNKVYYFGIKTRDNCNNLSDISNITSATSSFLEYTFSLELPKYDQKVRTLTPLFVWEDYDYNEEETYYLVISTDEAFTNPIQFLVGNQNQVIPLFDFQNHTSYYWKVFLIKENGDIVQCMGSYYKFEIELPIEVPLQRPFCYMTNNPLLASFNEADKIANIQWFVQSNDGNWNIASYGANNNSILYTAGTGEATFKIVFTDIYGNKDSCSISFGCINAAEHCSKSQGFYGNSGGTFCNGQGTIDLINSLLGTTGIFIGSPGHSFIIYPGQGSCVLSRLPGGGTPQNITGNRTCSNPGNLINQQTGKLKNILLAQEITLQLNLRLDNTLGEMPLFGNNGILTTSESTGCGSASPGTPIGQTWMYKQLPVSVYDELSSMFSNPTIQNLYDLANQALGGGTVLSSPGDLNNAITLINEAFDGCRFGTFDGGYTPENLPSGSFKKAEIDIVNGIELSAIPNPFYATTKISFKIPLSSAVSVDLYNLQGIKIKSLYEGILEGGQSYNVEYSAYDQANQIYICIIKTEYATKYIKLTNIR